MGQRIKSCLKIFVFITFVMYFQTEPVAFAQNEQTSGFFSMQSQSPIQQLCMGIQHHPPWIVPKGQWAFQIHNNWGNMWLYKQDLYRIDGEYHENVFRVAHGVTRRLEVMAQIPVRNISGGIIDVLSERFHDTFGYTQAGRDKYPRNKFAIEIYFPEKDTTVTLGSSAAGWKIGNLILSTTYDLIKNRNSKFNAVITGNIKLPTVTTKQLYCSQKIDLGLTLGLGYSISPLHLYYNAGFLYYGEKEVMCFELRRWHLSSLIAFEYRRSGSNHSWIFQGLMESGVAKYYNEFDKPTFEIVAGYKHYYKSGWTFGVGILENAFYYDNSPDVAFHLELTRFL